MFSTGMLCPAFAGYNNIKLRGHPVIFFSRAKRRNLCPSTSNACVSATVIPCEIRKLYFSSLQQYNDFRNVKATILRRFPEYEVDFIFCTDEKIFTVTPQEHA